MKFKKLLFVLLALCALNLFAQEKEKWDVSDPGGPFKEVEFTVNEGTWMNLDLSPDGQTIVFDMLGDIYSIPAKGGEAKLLTGGLPWEVQPRFSPDGKKILFTSDAGGADNIWWMDTKGENKTQITKEDFRLLNNPEWLPDGQYIVARKHFTSERSLGAGEIWMYHISGGEGIQLTKRKNDQQDVNEPAVSKDGRYIYYSEDVYSGGMFTYNKDPNKQIYVIKKYDRQEGKTENVVSGPGGAVRPQLSNDNKYLAFVRRVRTKSVLMIQNLETGEQFPIFEGLSKDQQEAWAIFGSYTGFSWTPDDSTIIIWGQGKFWNVNIESKKATEIPFSVNAKHRLAETILFEQKVATDKFDVKTIRQATTSPNGKLLIFNAVGHLWKMNLPNGKPERLTDLEDFEFEPSFSSDGNQIVYVEWDDETLGTIIHYDLLSKTRKILTTGKGIYRTPSFSPDGKTIVFRKEGGNGHQGYTFSNNAGIYVMNADGSDEKLVSKTGEYPQFNVDGTRIFYTTGGYLFGSLKKAFHSIKPDGTDEKTIFNTKYTTQFVPSPDNKWVAFSELYKVYVAPMPQTGQPFGLSATTKAVPVAQVAKDAGISLHWSADSKNINWTLGNEYFSNSLTDRFLFLEGAVDSIPPMDSVGMQIKLELDFDKPDGIIAFTGARIITMEGDKVIENGTIVIEKNKIKALGAANEVSIPKSAKIIDSKGKTIMPGLIDVHAHLGAFRFGLSPEKHWQYYTNLAYGVTTTHDPSSNSEMTFSQSEMVKAGIMTGPRIFSTGTILYGADGDFKAVINNLDDARSALRRTKAYGAFQ